VAWWSTRDAAQEAEPPSVEAEAQPLGATDTIVAEPAVSEAAAEAPAPAERVGPEDPEEAEAATDKGTSIERSREARASPKLKPSPPPAAVPPASLSVVVYPWGDVWINGKSRGSAPLKNISLKPGRYRISAGQGQPTVSQTIRLRSGQQKKLKLDVTK